MSEPTITDFRLSIDADKPTIIFPGPLVATNEHSETIEQLKEVIKKNPLSKMIELGDGSRWRNQRMRDDRYALRRMPEKCPNIDDLGLPLWIKALLLQSSMKEQGGLIVIFGQTGAGKTSTLSATIAGRLQLHGGYALTLEDPPEHPIEGAHGSKGYCEQLDVDEMGGFDKAVHTALRCFPAKDSSMLGYGEIRENLTAAELVRIAVDGHLVLATMHAKSIPEGLQRLAAMANAAGEPNANDLLSTGLQLAIHQKFAANGRLDVQALPRDNKASAHIQKGEFSALKEEVKKQFMNNANNS